MKKCILLLAAAALFSHFKSYAQCNADFESSNRDICVNSPVSFINLSSGGSSPYTYTWTFGAGATPANFVGANPPTVVYTTTGVKNVTLTYTSNGGGCTDVISQQIFVYSQPVPSFTSNTPQCVGQQMNFTYTGSSALTYQWDFGVGATPSSSTVQNPQGIVYSSSGTKTITLTIDNGFCVQTTTQTITINATPTVSFTSTAPKCTGTAVDFTNTGTTTGVTYLWNFGSGATPATSTAANPSGVIYSSPGIKTVTLTTTNSTTGCAVTSTQTINIYETPVSSFTTTAPVCVGAAVDFTNTGSTGIGISYSWDFGVDASPQTSTAQNPTGIYYSSSGIKTVTLYVSNEYFCSAQSTQTITIDETPAASFTSTAPQCTNMPVDFTNTGSNTGVTYAWDFGSSATPATSTLSNPTGIVYSTSGIKTITFTITNSTTNCTSTIVQTIMINLTPSVSFTTNTPVCAMEGVNFSNSGSTGANWTYAWDFGQDALPAVSSSENPAGVYYETGGNKIVSLTISDGVCSHMHTDTLQIYSLPPAYAGEDTTICADRSVMIGDTPQVGFSYSWFPANTLSNPNIANPVASPIAPVTAYIVTMTNSTTGCETTDTIYVTMLAPLDANAGPDVSICRFDSIQIGAALIEGQSYRWFPVTGLSNPNIPDPIASPDSTTTYMLIVDGAGCDSVTDIITVIVHQLPDANAGADDTITVGSTIQLIATGGVQYVWSPETGLNNAGIYDPIASPLYTTDYIVTVTDVFGCSKADTIRITVIQPSFWVPSAFTPDGNGKNDLFCVRGEGITDFEFSLYNSWGQTIYYSRDLKQCWDGTVQTTGQQVPQGAYVYVVKGTLTNGDPVNVNGIVNLIR